MATYFVSRHDGAKDWVLRQGHDASIVSHLDIQVIKTEDVVLGILPIHMVAQLNERGARYFHLQMEVPEALRGMHLSADDMDRLGAKFVEYEVRRL